MKATPSQRVEEVAAGAPDVPGNVPGNHYDKYGSRNPIERLLVRRFLARFVELSARTGVRDAFEVGCGEGVLALELLRRGWSVRGADLEESVVAEANAAADREGYGRPFATIDLHALDPAQAAAGLIVCCEVLEHVPDPRAALDVLVRLARPWLLVSVPREPLWRALNLARGKYLRELGNTPGHLQHWSARGFRRLLAEFTDVVAVAHPLPWTMLLCRKR